MRLSILWGLFGRELPGTDLLRKELIIMASGSRRAVVTAIVGNGTLTVLKFAVARRLSPQR